ncbi:MAG TPA: Rap1a/Tai family immunity protein [Lysobacter sp.]
MLKNVMALWLAIACSTSAAWAGESKAWPKTAGDILGKCRSALYEDDPRAPVDPRLIAAANFGYCYAYLQAVQDARFNPGAPVYCIPEGTTPKQVVTAFVTTMDRFYYLEDEERGIGVDVALQMAYQCPVTTSP